MRLSLRLPMIMVLILGSISLNAQDNSNFFKRDRGAQYFLGDQDELLIPVNIWGFVQKPGQYMVPSNTDLISLLSYAGGPTENAKITNLQIVRNDPKLGNMVFKNVDVKKYLETADDRLNPNLKPGDTVIVKGTTFYWIKNLFDFLGKFAVFFNIYYLVVIARNYNK
jgi:polysaccharide biosynthesis/export protein